MAPSPPNFPNAEHSSRGDKVSGAYLVPNGRLRVFTSLASGKEATLYFVRPRETCVLALKSLLATCYILLGWKPTLRLWQPLSQAGYTAHCLKQNVLFAI